jgi:uncharacterized protein YjiS (DUF1127 family)
MDIYFDHATDQIVRPSLEGIFAFLSRPRAWLANRGQIARITRELSCHSDRDLADMGLTRSDIPAVARGTYRRP